MSFYSELKRRRVFHVVAMYIVGAWVVLQVADLAFPGFSIPEFALRYVWIGAFLLFPIALLFGWRYDITTRGIERTPPASADAATEQSLRRVDYAILSGFSLFALAVGFGLMLEILGTRSVATSSPGVAEVPANSIAVLPFVDMSESGDQQFFSDGVAEEILHELAMIADLHVASRSSAFTYRDQNLNIRSIAKQLGVAHILEGSVRRSGDRIRVTAQLIDASSDRHLLSQTYDRELIDIFAVQDEISVAIVDALKLALGLEIAAPNRSAQVVSIEAYDLYLKGLQAFGKGNVASWLEAQSHFEQAIDIEAEYASAWYRLAITLLYIHLFHEPKFEATEAAALRAIELDPDLGGAYTVLSLIYPWDPVETPELRTQAVSLSPNDPFVVMHYARALESTYRPLEADRYIERAVMLDPLNLENRDTHARFNMYRGRLDKALRIVERLIEEHPTYAPAWASLGAIKATNGDVVNGVIAYLRAMELDPDRKYWSGQIASLYLQLEDLETARAWVDQAKTELPDASRTKILEHAWLYLGGDFEAARQYAQSVFEADRSSNYFRGRLVADLLERNDYQAAIELILDHGDVIGSFIDAPIPRSGFELANSGVSINLARYLQFSYAMAGETAKATALANRLRFDGYEGEMQNSLEPTSKAYLREAQKLALEGRTNEALTALETAGDMKVSVREIVSVWQFGIRDNVLFREIREHPRFRTLLETIESDMAQQRNELEAQLQANRP